METTTDPCERLESRGHGGELLTAVRHGGQVLGWCPAGGGEDGDGGDRLWLSPLADCKPGSAIRGGVPVVFPQFSARGPLPRHGLVRDRPWDAVTGAQEVGPEGAGAALRMVVRDDEAGRRVWPHRFRLELTALAEGSRLTVELAVHNEGTEPFEFAAALHAYLRVTDADRCTLHGVGGLPVESNAAPGPTAPLPPGPLAVGGPLDVAVRGCREPVVLRDPVLGDLTLTTTGFTDVVVWNPGRGAEPADVPDGDSARFVCVEPAALDPVRVAPGHSWTGSATWTATANRT